MVEGLNACWPEERNELCRDLQRKYISDGGRELQNRFCTPFICQAETLTDGKNHPALTFLFQMKPPLNKMALHDSSSHIKYVYFIKAAGTVNYLAFLFNFSHTAGLNYAI